MKRIAILILAAIAALMGTEILVSKIIRYPTYGVEMKMLGLRGVGPPTNLFEPYSRYWTVEGGNKVYRRNNIGLPGIDVRISSASRYVFVLGDSFIEGYQVPPETIATSLLQKRLQASEPDRQVLNLGYSGHDPYDSYWRARFYEREYAPSHVCLVLEKPNAAELERQRHPLDFDAHPPVPTRLRSKRTELAMAIMNKSSFFNLITNLLKASKLNDVIKEEENEERGDGPALGNELKVCLNQFKARYGERFVLVWIGGDSLFERRLAGYCADSAIRFQAKNLMSAENRLGGKGHLSLQGNESLGECLYESLVGLEKR